MLAFAAAASALISGAAASGHHPDHLDQLDMPRLNQAGQRAEFGPDAFKFRFADPNVSAVTDNAAALQHRVVRGTNQFLSTLAQPGQAQFLTAVKPCGILLPHVHPRANEFYSVIYGIMDAGVAQENGAAQDVTLQIHPGEVFVVPQGTMHHNHNDQCQPNVFVQSFNDADPGAVNVVGALAAMRDGSAAGAAAIAASGADAIYASPLGAFALDGECLKRCGLPDTGAPGDGLQDLPDDFRALFGLEPVHGGADGSYGYKAAYGYHHYE